MSSPARATTAEVGRDQSVFLHNVPRLDLAQLVRFASDADQTDAVRRYLKALRRRRRK
jgi:hypothetical protein